MNNKGMIALGLIAVAALVYFYFSWKKNKALEVSTLETIAPKLTTPTTTVKTPTVAPSTAVKMSANMAVYPKNSAVNVRQEPSTNAKILATVPTGKSVGLTTGETKAAIDGTWYRVKMVSGYGWVRSDVVTVKAPANVKANPLTTTPLPSYLTNFRI